MSYVYNYRLSKVLKINSIDSNTDPNRRPSVNKYQRHRNFVFFHIMCSDIWKEVLVTEYVACAC